jgi:cyclase
MKILLLIFLFISFTAWAQDDFSKEIEKSSTINPSLYIIEGAGGNVTAFVGKSGTLLVDDDFAQMSEKLLSKLKDLGGSSPKYIVNTHFHYDHTGGNEAFGSTAIIVAADEVRDRLMSEQVLWKKNHPAVPELALPSLTYEDKITIYLNSEKIRIVHLPRGHTDGDSVVFFEKQKVASLGDLYFSGMFPIFHPEHSGSLKGCVHNLDFVLKELSRDSVVVPGHGPLSNRKELEQYRDMIVDSIRTVKGFMKIGIPLDEIIKKGVDSKWESYSHGFRNTAQWITSIFDACKKGDCP